MTKKALIISGPTASGKSALALKIAETKDITIINADALQIYQGLPILSSQPSEEERKIVPHLLYSHFKPQESCSVASWLNLAKSTLDQVFAAKKLPVIVGGTGMYISKIFDGITEIPEISQDMRNLAKQNFVDLGQEKIQEKLIELGENKILDKHRLIRAYEVFLQTKKTISWWHNQENKKLFSEVNFTHINLEPNREKLYQNCNLRFEKMLEFGAYDEVKNLISQGIRDDCQITKTLGFYEIRDFLAGIISREEMIKIATQKTRNYAKRQLTWFRHQFTDKVVFESSEQAMMKISEFI